MSADKKIKIAAVVGATASGKTALAAALAKRIGGEVVCCDSMQIYSGMSVGTAQPTEDEMLGVPHHLFGYFDPHIPFSCADYAESARAKIAEITARGAVPVLCGGTGLYLDALLLGCGDSTAAPDYGYRAELTAIAENGGAEKLYAMLVEKDAEAAAKIHPNNVRRVIRALEICRAAGSKSEYDRRAREAGMLYDAKVIGLRWVNRSELFGRIDRRVTMMLEAGLCEETARLDADGVFTSNSTAAQAIGYKEILPYVRGEQGINEAAEALRVATRHYAKRQITWFSAKPYIEWIDVGGDGQKTFEVIVKNAESIYNNI